MVYCLSFKNLRKLDKWRRKDEIAGLKKLLTAHKQNPAKNNLLFTKASSETVSEEV